jgi:hypothetical protein
MILRVHVPGAADHAVGDEIWQRPLSEVLAEQAEILTDDIAGGRLDHDQRNALHERVVAEMSEALVDVGDSYRAPDGVQYSLIDESEDRLAPGNAVAPFVEEVLGFEELPVGSTGSRRVIVHWSDGSEGEALRYYHDEVLVCEGDVLGKTREQLRSLHFSRDRDWRQS